MSWHNDHSWGDGICLQVKVKKVLAQCQSQHHEILLFDTIDLGKALYLNGSLQVAETDEHIYHELLVHPAMLNHRNPEKVLILGGGDGCAAREVFRHSRVKEAVLVEIDDFLVQCCIDQKVFGHQALQESRLTINISDAQDVLTSNEQFDVIIADFTDPPETPELYTEEFFLKIAASLKEDGVFATNTGDAGTLSGQKYFGEVYSNLSKVFSEVVPYTESISSFGDLWGWHLAKMGADSLIKSSYEFDDRLFQSLRDELRFLDGAAWQRSQLLRKSLRYAMPMR